MELPCWPAQNVVTPVERRKGGPINETIVLGIAIVILDNRAICVERSHASMHIKCMWVCVTMHPFPVVRGFSLIRC